MEPDNYGCLSEQTAVDAVFPVAPPPIAPASGKPAPRSWPRMDDAISDISHGLPPCRLRVVLDHIDRHLDSELRIPELAALVKMGPQYFAILFRRSTGLAPHQYIVRERLERASRLLAETAEPIAEIALEAGFASQSHLTDLFRRMRGTTPSRYRGAVSRMKVARAESA
jgi:AraC-like DNA-binding protein